VPEREIRAPENVKVIDAAIVVSPRVSRFVSGRYRPAGRTFFREVGEVAMTDSPVTVTPIFDQLVAEFGLRNRTPQETKATGAAAGARTPADETAEETRPGATT
jgi:hypothetical protein